jgi:hypothetical protein
VTLFRGPVAAGASVLVLRANEGVTITGDLAGALRPLRTGGPATK